MAIAASKDGGLSAMRRTHVAARRPRLALPCVVVSDAAEIRNAEANWKPLSVADELAEIHASHASRESSRNRMLADLSIAQNDHRADVSTRFEAAVALQAAKRSRTP